MRLEIVGNGEHVEGLIRSSEPLPKRFKLANHILKRFTVFLFDKDESLEYELRINGNVIGRGNPDFIVDLLLRQYQAIETLDFDNPFVLSLTDVIYVDSVSSQEEFAVSLERAWTCLCNQAAIIPRHQFIYVDLFVIRMYGTIQQIMADLSTNLDKYINEYSADREDSVRSERRSSGHDSHYALDRADVYIV